MAWAELNGWLRSRADADEFSGAVLVQQEDEVPYSGAYRPASRRWPVPNTLNTRFDTASITKLFTAVAALQLSARDGARWMRRSPASWIWTVRPSPAEVTLRHLLSTHRVWPVVGDSGF